MLDQLDKDYWHGQARAYAREHGVTEEEALDALESAWKKAHGYNEDWTQAQADDDSKGGE